MKTYVGIDPGMTGAVGVLWGDGQVSVYDLSGSHADTVETLKEAMLGHTPNDFQVCIEKVHSMPKQGVSSTFTFGYGAGVLEGACLALGLPYRLVGPSEWKRGLPKGKDAARDAARAAFPSLSAELRLQKHDGRAEAILLAKWAKEHDR